MANIIRNQGHPVGKTCLAFSKDGAYALTGGADSLVRIWRTDRGEAQEPDTAPDADDAITSIAVYNDGWMASCLDSHVRQYSRNTSLFEGLITRSAGIPIRCVAVDPKGQRVAVTSDELTVKVINLDDTTNIKLLDGHTKGVRKATWHPSGNLLTTCGSDGRIIVWDLSGEEPKQDKIIEGIIPAVADNESKQFDYDCSAVWHPSGHYFLAATRAHEIVTVSRSTWSKSSTFSDDNCTGDVTALSLSPNGVYLASACQTGIFIWSTATRRILFSQDVTSRGLVWQLAFSPTSNLLAWTNGEGDLMRWPDVIPTSSPDPVRPPAGVSISTSAPVTIRRGVTPLLFGDDDDEFTEKNIKESNPDDGNGKLNGGIDVDLDEHDDDWIIDDLGGGMDDVPEKGHANFGAREMVSVTKAQPSFQPGATPFVNKRRYLGFNNIGVIEVVDQDTHHIVNIEFHDQTTRKSYHFSDHFKYDLAAVGERGIVYACPPDNGHLAQITYKPYSTWAVQGEWTYALPKSERAVAVAAGGATPRKSLRARTEGDIEGNGYVAVATDKGVVRFFSGGGIQRGPVWAVDGEVISMVAGRDYLFVVHREGGTSLDGNQNLKYTLRTSDSFRVMHTGRLPVNKGAILKWIGITDEGAPVIYDSEERVMMLEHFRFTAQGSWVVLLDATTLARRQGKEESYWPVGATQSTFMCIILKGREQYPGFPRPLVQEIEMKMPYLDMDGPEAPKEERLARETILLDNIRDALEEDILTNEDISKTEVDLDKELIQLIQLACKHDRLQRALDAIKLLHHTASFDMASKIADFYHLIGLQEKIEILKADRLETDRLREDRDRRNGYRRAARPIPPADDVFGGHAQPSARPFQNAQPPPAIRRPGLGPATPSTDPSPFARKLSTTSNLPTADVLFSSESKRKRGDDVHMTEDDVDSTSDTNTKRRATEDNVGLDASKKTASQPRPNPFAKKPRGNNNVDTNANPNPFQRKVGPTKSMHKSESFFEKVDAAEDENERGKKSLAKTKTKAPLQKQTTLFNLPVVNGPKMSAKSKARGEGQSNIHNKSVDSRENSVVDTTQDTDASMIGDESTLPSASQAETQSVGDLDNGASQVETQKDSVIEEMEVTDDPEPIEWPDSPPPMQVTIEVGED